MTDLDSLLKRAHEIIGNATKPIWCEKWPRSGIVTHDGRRVANDMSLFDINAVIAMRALIEPLLDVAKASAFARQARRNANDCTFDNECIEDFHRVANEAERAEDKALTKLAGVKLP